MTEQNIIAAEFFGSPVYIIDHNRKRWLTAEQIGICLGYGDGNARKGVSKLYNVHADEFTEADTCVVDLATQGQTRSIRIFSASGCIKLGFFANTPKAKQFRAWAAQTLDAATSPPSPPASYEPPPRPTNKPRINRQLERVIFEMFVAGQSITDIAKHLRISRTSASLVLHGKYQFGPSTGAPECSGALIQAVADRHLQVELERLAATQDRIAQQYLSSAHNLALAAALDNVGQRLQRAPGMALTLKGGAA